MTHGVFDSHLFVTAVCFFVRFCGFFATFTLCSAINVANIYKRFEISSLQERIQQRQTHKRTDRHDRVHTQPPLRLADVYILIIGRVCVIVQVNTDLYLIIPTCR